MNPADQGWANTVMALERERDLWREDAERLAAVLERLRNTPVTTTAPDDYPIDVWRRDVAEVAAALVAHDRLVNGE